MSNPEISLENKSVRQDIDFYKIFKVFLSRWYWILGCVIIALMIAYVNLLYTPSVFRTQGQLQLKENAPTISTSQGLASQSYSYTDKIQAEGFVIASNEVLLNAISHLDYKISYFLKGRLTTSDVYPNKPFKIEIIQQDSVNFGRETYFVQPLTKNTFSLGSSINPKEPKHEYRYNQPIAMGNMIFKITSAIPKVGVYGFKFNSKDEFLSRASSLATGEAGKYTNVMSVSLSDENPAFAADMLNAIMKEYVKHDILQKKRSARQTVEFIETQLALVKKKADSTGKILTDYKVANDITDLSTISSTNLAKLTQFDSEKGIRKMEMLDIDRLEDQLDKLGDRLDVNLGLEGTVITGLLGGLIGDFNSLLTARESNLSKGFQPNSQKILDINVQIQKTKDAIRNNISSLKARNQTSIDYLDGEIEKIKQSMAQGPVKEKELIQLQSDVDVNNKTLNFLAERKLESQMNEAAVISGASIVNEAYESTEPISPNRNSVYSFAAMVGLATGFGLILLVRFLNPYIYDKETVESLTSTPIIGVIRKFPEYIDKNSRQALSLSKPKSVFAESVRSVRTNLSFMASHKKSKTICITSEVSGEGKSFVTVNLAGTLALIDKKVILIAADLRKSKLHKAFGSDNKIGLSSYLSGQERLENVVVHDDVHNIDFIPSGPVPPNPSELLHTEKMKELLTILAPKYDYVLVDTAPVGLVSDAIPLIRQSDVNLFVIRSGKSQFRAAAIPERLSREYGLSNLAIVLNAFGDDALHSNYYTTDYSRGGGNSTYYYSDYSGYAGSGYYDNDPKKWWEFWKKK